MKGKYGTISYYILSVVTSSISKMVSGVLIMGTPVISAASGIISNLGLACVSASVLSSGVVLQVQYA